MWAALPPTPTTPSESSLGDPSDDEATIIRRREEVIPVMVPFRHAFLGEPLGTHEFKMDEETSFGRLFALAKKSPAINDRHFDLKLGTRVWHNPDDVYTRMLQDIAVRDALGESTGPVLNLRIDVIFVPKPSASRRARRVSMTWSGIPSAMRHM